MKSEGLSARRLGLAFGIGLLLEAALLGALVLFANLLPDKVIEPVGDVLRVPGSYLVHFLAKVHHPGFEGQVAYVLLVPLVQWGIYSIVVYLWLSKRAAKRILPLRRTASSSRSK